jgi:hypothetical protein
MEKVLADQRVALVVIGEATDMQQRCPWLQTQQTSLAFLREL